MVAEPYLVVQGLSKTFTRRSWWGRHRTGTAALRNVGFSLDKGRTLGVVGPSGSGKSTLARCLAFFETPDSGAIRLNGREAARHVEIQLIFQQPAASLNPRFTALEIVTEPLVIQKRGDRRARRERAAEWLERVGLPRQSMHLPALEFSGGERQRLAIARALVLEPKLLILDESFTGLDLSIQAQITRLLLDLQARLELTCILITHDLALAASVSHEIAVMEAGAIVEHGATAELLAHPRHPVTRELLEAAMALSASV